MKFFQRQEVRQRMKIFGNRSRLRTGSRIGRTAAPTPAVECDDAVSGFLKGWNVVLPAFAVARIRVQQYKRDSATTRVRIPEANTGQVRVSLARRRRAERGGCNRNDYRQS